MSQGPTLAIGLLQRVTAFSFRVCFVEILQFFPFDRYYAEITYVWLPYRCPDYSTRSDLRVGTACTGSLSLASFQQWLFVYCFKLHFVGSFFDFLDCLFPRLFRLPRHLFDHL